MENQQLRGMKGLNKDALEGKCLWEIAMRKDYFGSALHSHCRGQRFESAMLHHRKALKSLGFKAFFIPRITMELYDIFVEMFAYYDRIVQGKAKLNLHTPI